MAQKKTDNRVEVVEKEMKQLNQSLPGLEHSVEQLTQNMARMMQTLEATQKAIVALSFPKVVPNQNQTGEGFGSVLEGHNRGISGPISNRQAVDKGKEPEVMGKESYVSETILTGHTQELYDWGRVRKLEMPVFSGENPDSWLYRAKRYFEVNGLTENEKLSTVGVSLDGEALSWLQWPEARKPFQNWDQFQGQLLLRF